LFNKIRFENKINIEMRVSFEILENYVGERVNKISFVGGINKGIRLTETQYVCFLFVKKKAEKRQREGET